MTKARFAGLLVSIAAFAVMLTIPATSGAYHRWDIKIKTTNANPALHGVIASKAEFCERDRLVVVRRVQRGYNPVYGHDWSSRNGAWSVDINTEGTYKVIIDGVGNCGGDTQKVKVG